MRPTLADLQAELQRGGLLEAEIRNSDYHIDGYCDTTGIIVISPHVETVLTILHELAHRRYPRWGEKRVQRESVRLLREMSAEDVSQFYRAYRRRARKLRRPVTIKTKDMLTA